MRNVMILSLVLVVLVFIVNALIPPPEPVKPIGEYFQPKDTPVAELDELIAKSIARQRQINAELDEALHLHAEALRQLRSFKHNP